MTRRVGVFGGTFDPPHVGHLAIAEWARDRLALARVLLVPAGEPPHKRGRPVTAARHRLAMARLAARGNPAFAVSPIEAEREGPSFTVDTLRALRVRERGARLFLVIGADSLDDFPDWRDPEGILELATLAVAERNGAGGRKRSRPPHVRLEFPPLDISSSVLRRRARDGHSLRYLVPDPVIAYIRRHGLYGARS